MRVVLVKDTVRPKLAVVEVDWTVEPETVLDGKDDAEKPSTVVSDCEDKVVLWLATGVSNGSAEV